MAAQLSAVLPVLLVRWGLKTHSVMDETMSEPLAWEEGKGDFSSYFQFFKQAPRFWRDMELPLSSNIN